MSRDLSLIFPELQTAQYRRAFLEMVREKVPGILRELGAVAAESGSRVDEEVVRSLTWANPQDRNLADALRAWAKPEEPRKYAFNAAPPWLLSVLGETLLLWEWVPAWRLRDWMLPGASINMNGETATSPDLDPTRMSLTETKRAYLEQERELRRQGWVHDRAKPQFSLHLDWLVRYQVLREKWTDLAPEPSQMDNVQKRVKEVAKLVGLDLCAVRSPGRPPGSRDASPRHRN